MTRPITLNLCPRKSTFGPARASKRMYLTRCSVPPQLRRQIEDNLRGTIYDSYIRLMLWEGVRQWWRSSISSWIECPASLDDTVQVAILQQAQQVAFRHPEAEPDLSRVVCPVVWATETHKYTCALAFPPGLVPGQVPELHTKEYYDPIRGKSSSFSPSAAGLRS